MSRNIGETCCYICEAGHDAITLDEAPRPITAEDAGRYFTEYTRHLIVAAAHCVACGAKYLAWVRDLCPPWPREPEAPRRFVDLSFRSTFNDEPGPADLPSPDVLQQVHLRQRHREAARLMDKVREDLDEIGAVLDRAQSERSRWEAFRHGVTSPPEERLRADTASSTNLCVQLRAYFDPDDHDEDHDQIRTLMITAADELERLRADAERLDWLEGAGLPRLQTICDSPAAVILPLREVIDRMRGPDEPPKTTPPTPEGAGGAKPDAGQG